LVFGNCPSPGREVDRRIARSLAQSRHQDLPSPLCQPSTLDSAAFASQFNQPRTLVRRFCPPTPPLPPSEISISSDLGNRHS
jgi:hypothetical protein